MQPGDKRPGPHSFESRATVRIGVDPRKLALSAAYKPHPAPPKETKPMTVIALLPILLAIAGLLVALLASRQDVKICGYVVLGCGLLAFLLVSGTHVLTLKV